jgi:ParB-like chromosome segregation protein Spo0J
MEGTAVKRTITSKYGNIGLPVLDVKLLPLSKFIAIKETVQEHILDTLRESIVRNGIYAPVLVTWRAEEGKYSVIDGKKRYILFRDVLCAKEIPAVVVDCPKERQDDLAAEVSMKKGFREMAINKWREIL